MDDLRVQLSGAVGVATYPAGATFGPRRMAEWEWVWLIDGHARYTHDGTEHDAPPGSLVLCRPGVDVFEWDTKSRTRHAYFHFEILSLPGGWPPVQSWPFVRLPGEGDTLRPLFRHVLSWAGRGDARLAQMSTAHMVATWALDEIDSPQPARDALPEPVAHALKYLQARLDERPHARIELDDLARAAFVSPEHLCRVFKSTTGRTPMETVRLARLDRAATLLERTNFGVGEIARAGGWASPFHFSRAFKAAFGQSPQQMRQSLRGGAAPPLPRLLEHTAPE
jgi:AraC-like DNA-binding protein